MRRATGTTACWLTASVGLVGVIMLQLKSELSLTTPVTAAPSETPIGDDDQDTAGPIVGHLTDDVLDLIVERPLFSLSRRPFAAPVEEEGEAVEKAPRVQKLSAVLAGTMLAGDQRMALLTHPSKGLLRLREGQDVDGWLIVDVREDEVRLEHEGEVALLKLRKGVATKSSASPASAKNQPRDGGDAEAKQ